MLTFYLCFLAGGVVLPILSFFMGFLSDSGDVDLDTDVDLGTDIDFGTDIDLSTDVDFNMDTAFDVDTVMDPVLDIDMSGEVGHTVSKDLGKISYIETEGGSFFALGLIPTSLLALSALAISFGAVGALMTIGNRGRILTLLISIIIGYAASVIVQTIIKSLKKVQVINSSISENELLLYEGKIIDTILPGQLGTVSFVTMKKDLVSYPARCQDETMKLQTGRTVVVKENKDGVFIVEPKNKYEK